MGNLVKVKGFPGDYKLNLFRVVVNTYRTGGEEWIVTNDLSRETAQAAQAKLGRRLRWRIEELHREAKQLTGIERCQCRSGR
ncbi:hypothetical protein BH20ACT11_BH20ACT11_00110 [soil metagenome]